ALGSPWQEIEGRDVAALWQKLADLEERDGARLTFPPAFTTPAALPALESETCVFHALAGRLHLFSRNDAPRHLAAAGFIPIDARGAERPDTGVPPQVSIAS